MTLRPNSRVFFVQGLGSERRSDNTSEARFPCKTISTPFTRVEAIVVYRLLSRICHCSYYIARIVLSQSLNREGCHHVDSFIDLGITREVLVKPAGALSAPRSQFQSLIPYYTFA